MSTPTHEWSAELRGATPVLRCTICNRIWWPDQRKPRTVCRSIKATVMTACHLCGGYGMRHDPIAHGAEPTEEALEWATARTLHSTITGHNEWADGECVACGWDGGMEA